MAGLSEVSVRYGLPVLVSLILVLPAAALWTLWRTRHRILLHDALLESGMALGTAPWIAMTLTPSGSGRDLQLVPFADLVSVLSGADTLVQTAGNLLVLAALGALLPLRFALGRPWRTLGVVAGTAVLISAAVEAMQFALAIGRVSSVDDVTLNVAGAVLAALCTRRWWRFGRPRGQRDKPSASASLA